ncbi:DUF1254 domain-containing protein [Vibrio natriegens]|uniref:DUF1254 domain-containing protein n=1 Tax=Vibrio natriegens TaxID=691 RepID=UPI003DA01A88
MRSATLVVIFTMVGYFSSAYAVDSPIPKDSPQYGQWLTGAGIEGEPVGGQPPKGVMPSVGDFEYTVKYQAAFQTMLWSVPASAIYRFRGATMDAIGADDTTILSWHNTATPRLEAVTANSSTPYITAYSDLQKGPLVLEVPAASNEGRLYGQVVDAWQLTIADVGPGGGMDDGKGGKYLFTPPGYEGEVPGGYIHVESPNYRIGFALRSVVLEGKSQADAVEYAHQLRIYYLKDAANPPEQKFINPDKLVYPTLPFFDERAFEDLHAIFSVEPVRPQDKVMMGLLAELGIQHGNPDYAPDEVTLKAMRQAAVDVWYTLQYRLDNYSSEELYWPDRHYISLLMTDDNRMFTWEYDDRVDYIDRAVEYFWCTYMPKQLSDSPSTQYMIAMKDAEGRPLLAGKNYKVTIPKDMPVEQFWALTIYDRATHSFIYTPSERTTISSYDYDNLKTNDDGSVTLYVGPNKPAGLESNWINTMGKRPLPAIRFYGPTEAMNNKTFKLGDFELIE